jgi:phosphoglycolate phosphatase
MLSGLAELGVRLSVVSNKNGRYLREEASHLGWDKIFDRLVGAHDAEEDKPAPAPVRMALAGMDCPLAEAVWFVGDAAVDMECAANTGLIPVLLREEPPREQEFDRFPFFHHVKTCGELLSFVSQLTVAPKK